MQLLSLMSLLLDANHIFRNHIRSKSVFDYYFMDSISFELEINEAGEEYILNDAESAVQHMYSNIKSPRIQ